MLRLLVHPLPVLIATALACVALGAMSVSRATAQEEPRSGASPGHERMVATLAEIAGRDFEGAPFLNPQRLHRLRELAARMPADVPEGERLQLHLALGMEEFTLGTAEAAARELRAAYMLFPDPMDDARRAAKVDLAYHLGLTYLRWGERINCVANHTGESCILPIRGGGVHSDRRGAEEAVRYFREVLHTTPARTYEHVAAKWLLNLAYGALGTPREEIPRSEQLPPDALAPEADFPRFPNIAPEVGLDTVSLAGGAVVEDLDGDGDLDVLTSSWHPAGPMHFFENTGDGRFVDRTEAANLEGLTGGLNMVHADYDGDGDPDVLVLRGAWLGEHGKHPNSLLRNDGGRFTDVTFEAGLGEAYYPTQTAAWADYDGDGDLDLYVGNEHKGTVEAPGQLFRNDGGRFTDVAREAGVENLRFAKGVAWGDYDNDGDPDLYVSNGNEANRLYRNDGGTFVDVAEELGVTGPLASFPIWFFDYDNDGHLDLYVASYPGAAGQRRLVMTIADEFGIEETAETTRLYRGDGEGGFRDVTAEVGLDRISMPMGVNFGDLDNDGYLDFYLGTGYPSWDGLVPNELYWNRDGERFDEVATAAGLAHLQKGHGVAFADFDRDGDQDVFEQMGGFFPEDDFADALYENPGFGHHWLEVELVGTRSNRSAIGARIRAEIDEGGTRRSIHRRIGTGGSFGSGPLAEHLGLGRAERVATLEIHWPVSGITQTFHDLPADRAIRITEGEEGYEVLEREPVPFHRGEVGHRDDG